MFATIRLTTAFSRSVRALTALVLAGIFAAAFHGIVLTADVARANPGPTVLAAGVWVGAFFLLSRILARLPERVFLALLMAISVGARLGWLVAVPNEQVSDFAVYEELAASLATGQGYALSGPAGQEELDIYLGMDKSLPYRTAYRAPGTSLWGAGLYRIFKPDPIVFNISNLFLGAGASFLIYLLLRRGRAARMASTLWAIYPSAVFATNLFCSEILFVFFLLLSAVLLSRTDPCRPPPWKLAILGLTAAWCSLVRPMWVPFVAAATVAWVGTAGWRKAFRSTSLFFLFFLVGISPWAARNWTLFGSLVPISTLEGDYLGRHTSPFVPEHVRQSDIWRRQWLDWRAQTDEAVRASQGYAMAVRNWAEMLGGGPSHVLACIWWGLRATFGDDIDTLAWSIQRSSGRIRRPGPDRVMSAAAYRAWATVASSFYLAILGLALFAPGRARFDEFLDDTGTCFLLLYGSLTAMIYMVVLGLARYHFTVMPTVLILASCALSPGIGRCHVTIDNLRSEK